MTRRGVGVHSAVEENEWNKKKYVWIPVDSSYELARLGDKISDETGYAILDKNSQQVEVRYDTCEPVNPPRFDAVEDMAELTRLNIPSVMHLLKKRYHEGNIYTYSGLFCVVVNPYKMLPIYGDAQMARYKGRKRHELPPHVYAVADNSYRDMLENRVDQSILCTGESGAGKTENTKRVIQHLTFIAGKKQGDGVLEKQILQSNPILEAFGNAKTIKNDNSSRFGKFIRVNFDHSGSIAGANIETYILEKARIVRQSDIGSERNFHIFYQLLAGADAATRKDLLLADHGSYKYLSNGNVNVAGMNDADEFRDTMAAMDTMNMTPTEKKQVLEVISCVLQLGNLSSKISNDRGGEQARLSTEGDAVVENFCKLTGCKARDFKTALLSPKMRAGAQIVKKAQNKEQVEFAIEALSKAIYERLFDWLVKRINHSLRENVGHPGVNFIGILDIAGFEIFEVNSFEQLCINLTNERLQQLFNHTLFVKEQEEYASENIQWKQIDYGLDLIPTIDLIAKPNLGIMALLDQACLYPKASDKDFVSLVHTEKKNDEKLIIPRAGERDFQFAVIHYAGQVNYQTDGWLQKNMDQLNDNVVSILGGSNKALLKELFSDAKAVASRQKTQMISMAAQPMARKGKGGGMGKGLKRTVGALYGIQLKKLLDTLNATQANFVRCIIPNHKKAPNQINDALVIDQLKCNGVIEGIRIVRQGYPNRQVFSDFRQRYGLLCPNIANSLDSNSRNVCQKMLDFLELDETTKYKLGTTKIFFKVGVLADLETQRDEKLEQIIVKLQAKARGYLARKKLKSKGQQERCIKILQRNMKIYLACREWQWWHLMNKIKPLLDMRQTEAKVQDAEDRAIKAEHQITDLSSKFKNLKEREANQAEELESFKEELTEANLRNEALEDSKVQLEQHIDQLQEQCDIFNNEIESEKTMQNHLRMNLKDAQERCETLGADLADAHMARDKLHGEKVDLDGKNKHLENELEFSGQQVEKLSRDKKTLEEQFADLEAKLSQGSSATKTLMNDKKRLQGDLDEVNDYLAQAKNQVEELSRTKKALTADRSDLETRLADALARIKQLEDELAKKDREIKSLQQDLDDATNKLSVASRELAQARDDLQNKSDECDTVTAEKARLKKKTAQLEQETAELKDTLYDQEGAASDEGQRLRDDLARIKEEAANEKSAMETEITTLKKQRQNLSTEKADLEAKVSKVEGSLRQTQKEFNTSKSDGTYEIENLNTQIATLQTKIKQIETRTLNLQTELDQSRAMNEAGEIEKSNLGKRCEQADFRSEELENQLHETVAKLKSVTAEAEEARQGGDMLSEEKSRIMAKLQAAQREATDLRADLDDANADAEGQKNRLRQADEAIKAEKAKNEELKSEVAMLNDEKASQRKKLTEKDTESQDLEARLRTAQQTQKRVESQRDDLQMELDNLGQQLGNVSRLEQKFEREARALRERAAHAEAERDAAQAATREAESNAYRQKTQRDELESELAAAKSQIEKKNAEIAELESDAASNADLEAMQKKNRNFSEQIAELKNQVEEERDIAYEESKKAQQFEGKIVKLEAQVAQKQSELDGVQEEADMRVNRVRMELAQNEEDLATATRKLQNAERARAEKDREAEDLRSQLEGAESIKDDLGQQNTKLKLHIRENETEMMELKAYRQKYEDLKRSGDQSAGMKDREIDELQADVARLRQAKTAAEDRANDLESDLDTAQSRETAATRAKNTLQARIQELEGEQDDYIVEIEQANAARKQAEVKYNELNGQLETAKADAEQYEADARKYKAQLTASQEELQSASANAKRRYEGDINRLRAQIEELESEKATAVASAEQAKSRYNRQRTQLTSMEAELQDLKMRIGSIEGDLRTANRTITRKNHELEDANADVARYKRQRDAATQERDDGEAEISRLTKESTQLRTAMTSRRRDLD